jgi:hypothetical protein
MMNTILYTLVFFVFFTLLGQNRPNKGSKQGYHPIHHVVVFFSFFTLLGEQSKENKENKGRYLRHLFVAARKATPPWGGMAAGRGIAAMTCDSNYIVTQNNLAADSVRGKC